MSDGEFRDLPTPQPLKREEGGLFAWLAGHRLLLAVAVGLGLVVAVVSGALLWPWLAGRDDTRLELPPSLEELTAQYPELASLFNDPALGSVYKDFMVAYEEGGIDAARTLAAQRGLLNDRDEIRITLVLLPGSEAAVPAISAELQQVGITVEGSYKERINVGVPLALIERLAAQQGTQTLFQQLTQMQHIRRLELPESHQSDGPLSQGVDGEGVAITGADAWHAAGLTGQNIRVGVLDLGFDGYRGLLGTELPESVVAASFAYGVEPDGSGEVHGTACAEIVHEMAPGAALYLAYYDSTLVSMGQAVDWLLAQGVHIITNSTTGLIGPMDGTDESAEMVDNAVSQGVLWVNSSGNAAEEHYRGVFVDSDGDGLHEFPDGTEIMGVAPYGFDMSIALNWDDWRGLTEDYDLYLFDRDGALVSSAEDIQSGVAGQAAAELLIANGLPDDLYLVSIKAHSVTRPGTFDLYTMGAALEFPVPDHSLGSPADAQGALAVGATEQRDDSLATYSSQGPSNDGRLKPELSAPAGVRSVTYSPGVFDGTSASTPHVAGAAALVWSAFPTWSAGQVRDYLQANALDRGDPGPDNGFGYGRLLLPPPPGQAAPEPGLPEPLPTLPPQPTAVPEPTVVAILPGSEAKPGEGTTFRGLPLAVVGGLGLCGGLLALAGGGLLIAALVSASRHRRQPLPRTAGPGAGPGEASGWSGPTAPPRPAQPATIAPRPAASPAPETMRGYGQLVAPGRAPLSLRSGSSTIGRSADNDLVVDSLLVSRRHARFECAGGQCSVEDLSSANGVLVNGRRVTRAVLSPGDRLRLGDVDFTYQLQAGPTPQPTSAPGLRQAWLEVGANRYPLSTPGLVLGRSHESDVTVPDQRASRQHARIDLQAGQFVISDLGSANGTFVNGQRVQSHPLRDGDEIRIGDTQIRFHSGAPSG